METIEKKVTDITTYKVAVFAALAMILFFLFMKMIGLVTVVELRFLNYVIMFFAVRYILLSVRRTNNGKLEYLKGMMKGFMTVFFTSVFFAAFVFIYLSIDRNFMNYLKDSQPFGSYLTAGSAALVNLIEGTAIGAIISFALMHLLNRDNDRG